MEPLMKKCPHPICASAWPSVQQFLLNKVLQTSRLIICVSEWCRKHRRGWVYWVGGHPPCCTLTADGFDQAWKGQKMKSEGKKAVKIQISFRIPYFWFKWNWNNERKTVSAAISLPVTPSLSPEHCSPGPFDTQAGAGDMSRPMCIQPHIYQPSSGIRIDRRRHRHGISASNAYVAQAENIKAGYNRPNFLCCAAQMTASARCQG